MVKKAKSELTPQARAGSRAHFSKMATQNFNFQGEGATTEEKLG